MSAATAMLGMVRAEWTKIWRRGFGTVGLVLAGVHAILVFLLQFAFHAVQKWGVKAPDRGAVDIFDGVQTGEWTVFALYLPVMGVVLLAVVGELFAGEYSQRTYSLLLIRPVPRWQVFAAKFLAAYGYVLMLLAAAAVVATVLGLAAFGTSRVLIDPMYAMPGELGLEQSFGLRLGELGIKFVAVALSLVPVVALTALLAVVTRSTALTVTYTIILLIIDGGIWLTFPWVAQALEYEVFAEVKKYTLMASRSFMFPYYFQSAEMTLAELLRESALALGLLVGYTATFVGGAIAVFTLQDIE